MEFEMAAFCSKTESVLQRGKGDLRKEGDIGAREKDSIRPESSFD